MMLPPVTPTVLYDSDRFVVLHIVANDQEVANALLLGHRKPLVQHVYEIVDKDVQREVVLQGAWAEDFFALTKEWQQEAPAPETVEKVLDGYAQLAQLPIILH